MKTLLKFAAVALLIGALNAQRSTALAQGTLTPPGAPAPTMKSLAQIEPRTPISSLPFTITVPGSYYVTTNLAGTAANSGISINSGNVTVDLDGFTLQGVPGSYNGVVVMGTYDNVVVQNGTLTGWGACGANAESYGFPRNLVFEHLTLSANGSAGLLAEAGSLVRDCASLGNTNDGFTCVGGELTHCLSRGNGGFGFSAGVIENGSGCSLRQCLAEYDGGGGFSLTNSRAIDCVGQYNTGPGFILGASAIQNCLSQNNNSPGVSCYGAGDEVSGSHVTGNQISGIYVYAGCGGGLVKDCVIGTNGMGIYLQGAGGTWITGNSILQNGLGINVLDSNNRIENNSILISRPSNSTYGIYLNYGATNNVVIKNLISGGLGGGYGIIDSGGNDVGPLGSAATSTSPWANFQH
jgi:parallel beta-helix repeat protein